MVAVIRRSAVVAALALLAVLLLFSSAPPVHGQVPDPVVTFETDSVAEKFYTVGAAVLPPGLSDAEIDALRLPPATLHNAPAGTVGVLVSYTATDLPDGLSLGANRLIHGIPTRATSGSVEITYTATYKAYLDHDNDSSTDPINTEATTYDRTFSFLVTVKPAVTFSAEASLFIHGRAFEWKDGSWRGAPLDNGKITFPEAQGGHGAITYSLIDNNSGSPLSSVASGITFDANNRQLGGTPATAARITWPVRYYAEDENGSRAVLVTQIYAGGYGGL